MNRRQGLAITIAYTLIFLIMSIPYIASNNSYEGELAGDLVAKGRIWTDTEGYDGFAGIGHIGSSIWGGGLRATVSNVSKVRIFDPPDGDIVDEWVNSTNGTIEFVCDDCWVSGYWQDFSIRGTLSELNGTLDDEIFKVYLLDTIYASLNGSALVVHQPDVDYDLYVFPNYNNSIVIEGKEYNRTICMSQVEGERATITFNGSGDIRIAPDPLFHIDGSLRLSDMKRTNVVPPLRYQHLIFEGNDIEFIEVQRGHTWSSWRDHYEPEIVKVILVDDSEVASRVSYLVLALLVGMLLIAAVWLIKYYRWRQRINSA